MLEQDTARSSSLKRIQHETWDSLLFTNFLPLYKELSDKLAVIIYR